MIRRTLIALIAAGLLGACGSEPAAESLESVAAKVPPVYDPSSLSGQAIPNDDLPPAGTRSLFDHLVAQNGQLPYPFEDVVDWIASLDKDGKRPTTVLVPHGRSLQKGKSSFADPRVILTADITPPDSAAGYQPIYKGRLFLGFVDNAAEIEVLSYNEAAGRFEFQLVKDYCEGCTPRIVYAQRNVCLTCHQNGAGIFPVRPWQETNASPEIAARIHEALPDRAAYAGAPMDVKLEAPETIDNNTDISNVVPVAQRVWLDGCGDGEAGRDCRRLMLKLALQFAVAPGRFDAESADAQALTSHFARNWPERGVAIPNNNLLNRDPLQDDLYSGGVWAGIKRALFGRTETTTAGAGDKLADFDALPPLPPELDPLTLRQPETLLTPNELEGVYALAQLFAAADLARLEQQAGYDTAALLAAADHPALTAHVDAVPFRRMPVTDALLTALGAERTPLHWGMDLAEMSPPIFEGEPKLELAEGSELQPFETYCFGCHRGNPNAKLNFMAGADEAAVLANIQDTDTIRDVLDYERYLGSKKASTLMPPEGSWQRDKLDAVRSKGEDPWTAMRDQVPSLFEF